MLVEQAIYLDRTGWKVPGQKGMGRDAQLALIFGETSLMKDPEPLRKLRAIYPSAVFFGCSTAGEISGVQVLDDSIVATAVSFGSAAFRIA
jgi:hypothetical protein